MPPVQIFHAFLVAREGNVVVPSELLKEVTTEETSPDLSSLPPLEGVMNFVWPER